MSAATRRQGCPVNMGPLVRLLPLAGSAAKLKHRMTGPTAEDESAAGLKSQHFFCLVLCDMLADLTNLKAEQGQLVLRSCLRELRADISQEFHRFDLCFRLPGFLFVDCLSLAVLHIILGSAWSLNAPECCSPWRCLDSNTLFGMFPLLCWLFLCHINATWRDTRVGSEVGAPTRSRRLYDTAEHSCHGIQCTISTGCLMVSLIWQMGEWFGELRGIVGRQIWTLVSPLHVSQFFQS